ncbi:MAG: hypothetical protein GYA14_10190 [Ignavibacteria bacterium]|nr:hypothetical protein [Ignavibacteria bacterium]
MNIIKENLKTIIYIGIFLLSSITLITSALPAGYCTAMTMCSDGTGRACYGLERCGSVAGDRVSCDGITLLCSDPW